MSENKQESKSKVQRLLDEVEVYKQAIRDARDALASAEMELDEELEVELAGLPE